MEQYLVTGMSCAACSARVEKAVKQVPGVSSCSVSLLTNSMGVEGTADPQSIIAAVEAAGYGVSDVLMNIVVTGVTNVIFTIVAMFVVDRWGRKKLALLGAFGLAIIYAFMGLFYYLEFTGVIVLIVVVCAIACYAMTLATVMWVIVSEIFPNRVRGIAMSVCTFALWAACFLLTYTFPLLNAGLGAAGTFWLYGAICLVGGIFIVKLLPETKGKSLEEIEKELVK